MQNELKVYCVHCGGAMEFPPDLAGEKIVCPHCRQLTFLGNPKAAPPPIPIPSFMVAPPLGGAVVTTQRTGKGIKCGLAVCVLGVVISIVLALTNPVWWLAVFVFGLALILFRALRWWHHG